MPRALTTLVLVSSALFGAACGGGSSSTNANVPAPGTVGGKSIVPQVAHVFVIVEENHSYSEVVGSSSMPYLNGLISTGALATQYYANAHPSLPNYFVLTTGATITYNDGFTGIVSQDNVVRALTNAGKSWKCYAESLPSAGYLGTDAGAYLQHHVPFVYFSDVQNDPAQAANVVPFTQLAIDLAGNSLPDYSFIVPDIYDDAHTCPGGAATCAASQELSAADTWLQANIDPLIKSAAFQNSLMIITFDESDTSDIQYGGGHVATMLVGARVKAGYHSSTLYLHQSTLRLTMKALGVPDFPGASSTATEMGEFFQ